MHRRLRPARRRLPRPSTHLMGLEGLKWEKVEDGKHYMTRAQYDMCNEQL